MATSGRKNKNTKKSKAKNQEPTEKKLLGEVSFLLSEKRTYLSISRTGLAVVALAFTALAFLLTTENYHGIFKDFRIAFVVVIGFMLLMTSGIITFLRAERKVAKLNDLIEEIKVKNKRVRELVV